MQGLHFDFPVPVIACEFLLELRMNQSDFTTLKIALVAPMPIVNDKIAAKEKTGDLNSIRRPRS